MKNIIEEARSFIEEEYAIDPSKIKKVADEDLKELLGVSAAKSRLEQIGSYLNSSVEPTIKKNKDGSYDVIGGSVDLSKKKLTKLPVKYNKVEGKFICGGMGLESLEGAPKEVGGDFRCSNNKLTSLEGAPKKVGGLFDCGNNELTSLEGAPVIVGDGFYCNHNKLTSLEGAPKKVGGSKYFGRFECHYNKLTSLVGAPKEIINGWFRCSNNKLTSLEGAPKKVEGDFFVDNNKAKFTKEDVKKVCDVEGKIYV